MNRKIFQISIPILLVALLGAGFFLWDREASQPEVQIRIEAEAFPVRPDLQIVEIEAASGGKAVSIEQPWHPLLLATLPEEGRRFTLWVRHRHGPLLVKGERNEKQHEIKWIYDAPEEWTWTKVGRFSRRQLGERVLVMRGDEQKTPDALLDCIVLSTDDNADPDTIESSPNDQGAPDGVLLQAEKHLGSEGLKISEAEGALDGKAVSGDAAWQPLFKSELPDEQGFMVWVRHRGGPLLVKTRDEQDEWDVQWLPNQTKSWQWSNAGMYARADLGETFLILRGGADNAPAELDAVVFSPQHVEPLPPFRPDENAEPLTIAAEVDWTRTVGNITPQIWGINDYEILDPAKAADNQYQAYLSTLRPSLLRIHQGELADRWTDSKSRSWDVAKIRAGFKASTGYGDARIMLNIPDWPRWLSDEQILPPEREDEFAALCGQLARLMRDEIGQPIAYWELLNEKEAAYEEAGKLNDLWRLWNKMAVAVKEADPQAKIGGPALANPKPEWLQSFLQNCAARADFLSWHNYAIGDIYVSNEEMLRASNDINRNIEVVRSAVQKYADGRNLELFLTEYNIKWTWQPVERRQGNNLGAVFQAGVLRRVAMTEIDGLMLWHAKGNAYGLMDDANNQRPPAYLYQWGRQYLTGRIAAHSSADESQLELLPVIRADGSRSLLLINKANRRVRIQDIQALMPPTNSQTPRLRRVDAHGYTAPEPFVTSSELELPGYSVTLLTTVS